MQAIPIQVHFLVPNIIKPHTKQEKRESQVLLIKVLFSAQTSLPMLGDTRLPTYMAELSRVGGKA